MFDEAERIGLAISTSNGYRTRRPRARPKKSKGHGTRQVWRDRLKEAKPPARPPAVPKHFMPTFLTKMLLARPEARSQLTREQYEASKNKNQR